MVQEKEPKLSTNFPEEKKRFLAIIHQNYPQITDKKMRKLKDSVWVLVICEGPEPLLVVHIFHHRKREDLKTC